MSTKNKNNFKSWPFKEAQRVISSFGKNPLPQQVLFQTGYGPSGLPHIGTFAEVARTTWVMNAYKELCGGEAKIIAFSDDLDGLRKVPGNLPNKEMLAEHLGKPLCDIPDPYGCCKSFSGHMIGKLKEFLDTFGFEYELRSASSAYRSGDFNDGLKVLLERVDLVLDVILPTMKEENRAGWSPFLPKCDQCGKIYTTRVTEYHKDALELSYTCDGTFGDVSGCGHSGRTSVLNGGAKMGWKVDWALRWYSYGINYEMYGKDLIPSATLSSQIVKIMGGRPPIGFFYEMFLDEKGEKISKSVGNGVSMDEWLAYAPVESLAYFIFRDPRAAKKLYVDMIPRTMDEYLDHLRRYPEVPEDKKPDNPLWHIHRRGSGVPAYQSPVNFTMVNNLVSALGMEKPEHEKIAEFLTKYDPDISRYSDVLMTLIDKGVAYYLDRILPNKAYREATANEKAVFLSLKSRLQAPDASNLEQNELQSLIFDVAKSQNMEPKEFFGAIYQVLLGQEQGPRFGSFAKLVGVHRVIELIEQRVG
ncbi:MAG: lysine--tRNA ligase [Deltaproteobacteria bacterium]|nr:lysine--tRNA ligase [Deltaproteobacteria bacterium]